MAASMKWFCAPMAALLLSACAGGPRPLYGWGHYEESVYSELKGGGNEQEQIDKLTEDLESFKAHDQTPPPGFYAQLGYLYMKVGQDGKAAECWQTERERWPESRAFFDFLMKEKGGHAPALQPPGKAGNKGEGA
jgi:hypothetical protein